MDVPPLNLTQATRRPANGDSIVNTPNTTTNNSTRQEEQKTSRDESQVGKSTDSEKNSLINSIKAR